MSSKVEVLEIDWKVGFEVELLAPRGSTRRDLAEVIASQVGGRVERIFLPQSEPSLVPGKPVFHNLTLGFDVLDENDERIVRCVDDLTLQDDLLRSTPPLEGWYRIISDDPRLLRLIARHTDANLPISDVLEEASRLFGAPIKSTQEGMFHLADELGASIAIAAPLPGERERPCEIITPPIETAHRERLGSLLMAAKSLGFTLPREAAVHIHYDAAPLCSARTIANLVNFLHAHGPNLRRLLGTNPNCRRLGGWSETLLSCVRDPHFPDLSWDEARAALAECKPAKYCDFNLRNIALDLSYVHTFEVRIIPGLTTTEPIIEAAALFEAILRRAMQPQAITPRPQRPKRRKEIDALLSSIPLSAKMNEIWRRRAQSL